MLDTLRKVDTPEGVQLTLPLAGPVIRARAWIYDLLIKGMLLWVGGMFFALLGSAGPGPFLIFYFLVSWLYPVVFEVLRDGATPGKQIAGLRVVHDDGMPVGWSSSLIRSIVGFVDMLPFGYATGLVATLLNDDAKRLGDMAAGTVVIHASRPATRVAGVDVEPSRPPIPLGVEEQHALVELAARSPRLSRARLDELAQVAEPLTGGEPDVGRLLSQARWIMGDR